MNVSSTCSSLVSASAVVAGATAAGTIVSSGLGALAAKALGIRVVSGAVFGAFSGAMQGAVGSGICKRICDATSGNDGFLFALAGTATFFASTALSWQICKSTKYDIGSYTDAMTLGGTIVALGAVLVVKVVMIKGCATIICKKCCPQSDEEAAFQVHEPFKV